MKRLTDNRLLVVGIAAAVIALLIVAQFAPAPAPPPFSVRNDGRSGAMVLRRWLDKSGYETRQLVTSLYDPADLDVLFVLNPSSEYTLVEAQVIRDWVQQGHTLIVAGEGGQVNSLLEPFDISLEYVFSLSSLMSLTAPSLVNPPVGRIEVQAPHEVRSTRSDLAMHVAVNNRPVLASFAEGAGTVWVVGSAYPFTNLGIQQENNAQMILNLLAHDPPGARVGFDEALHGFEQTPQAETLLDWLISTPPGWSILLGFGLTMVFVLLRGRRFGRPIPLLQEQLRREPVEYIQAIAHLMRRSGQRQDTLRHYRQQFRRLLAQRYAVRANLDADAMSRLVAERDPRVDQAELREILLALGRPEVSEHELVTIALQVDTWIRNYH